MKTFSSILIVVIFGTFGWLGLEKKQHKSEVNTTNVEKKPTDLDIKLAENNCAKLELEIQKKQNQISEILKQQP